MRLKQLFKVILLNSAFRLSFKFCDPVFIYQRTFYGIIKQLLCGFFIGYMHDNFSCKIPPPSIFTTLVNRLCSLPKQSLLRFDRFSITYRRKVIIFNCCSKASYTTYICFTSRKHIFSAYPKVFFYYVTPPTIFQENLIIQ